MDRTGAVIFDCDGTLLDSMSAWHRLEQDLAWMSGIELSPAQIALLNANTLSQTVAYFHANYGVGCSYASLLQEAYEVLLEGYRTSVEPRLGARELVQSLKANGVKLAVASSSSASFLRAGLDRAGILDAFSVVASAEDEQTTKRDPRFVLSVAARLNADPSKTWCIDDSVYAIEVMNKAGFSTVGVYDSDEAGTRAQLSAAADVAVDELTELDADLFVKNPYKQSIIRDEWLAAREDFEGLKRQTSCKMLLRS